MLTHFNENLPTMGPGGVCSSVLCPLHTGYNLHPTVLNEKSNDAFVIFMDFTWTETKFFFGLKMRFFLNDQFPPETTSFGCQ